MQFVRAYSIENIVPHMSNGGCNIVKSLKNLHTFYSMHQVSDVCRQVSFVLAAYSFPYKMSSFYMLVLREVGASSLQMHFAISFLMNIRWNSQGQKNLILPWHALVHQANHIQKPFIMRNFTIHTYRYGAFWMWLLLSNDDDSDE